MAAKVSLVLERMQDVLNEVDHTFTYAPSMDAPYLDNEVWNKAYEALRTLVYEVSRLRKGAIEMEDDLIGGDKLWTAEQYRDVWNTERYA